MCIWHPESCVSDSGIKGRWGRWTVILRVTEGGENSGSAAS